jgi:hypothetical protein
MYGRQAVRGDPFWLSAKYEGNCSRCQKAIYIGNRIFYYPRSKKAYCEGCGKTAEQDFLNMSEMDRF